MPKFVLGGLLIYLGADQLHRWIVESRQRLSTDRISVAAGDHRHHRAMGLHRRHPDRRRDRLRDLCAERLADRFDQIRLRRLGISQFAGPLARRPGGAARRMAARSRASTCRAICSSARPTGSTSTSRRCWSVIPNAAFWCSISSWSPASIRRPPTVSPRSSGRRTIAASGWCWCICPPRAEKALRSSEFISDDVSIIPELDHALEWCENEIIAQHQGSRAGRSQPARLVHPDSRRPRTTPTS